MCPDSILVLFLDLNFDLFQSVIADVSMSFFFLLFLKALPYLVASYISFQVSLSFPTWCVPLSLIIAVWVKFACLSGFKILSFPPLLQTFHSGISIYQMLYLYVILLYCLLLCILLYVYVSPHTFTYTRRYAAVETYKTSRTAYKSKSFFKLALTGAGVYNSTYVAWARERNCMRKEWHIPERVSMMKLCSATILPSAKHGFTHWLKPWTTTLASDLALKGFC